MPFLKYTKAFSFFIISILISLSFQVDSYWKNQESQRDVVYPNTVKNWTMMLYFCADTRSDYVTSDLNNSGNGLYIDMLGTLNYIDDNLQAGFSDFINIIALFDYPWTVIHPHGYAEMYEITPSGKNRIAELNNINMGDPQTLEDFITFCKTNYPANYYSLSLVDHGRGYAGFCYDYHSSHPYWAYALGDCLTVEEIDTVLDDTGGVDILCLDTCSGGAFEVAWQFTEEVDYLLAGESMQWNNALVHSVEMAYNLSRNVGYTPFQFAQSAFDCAKKIQIYPWNLGGRWKSNSWYDLTQFDAIGASQNVMEIFSDFTDLLLDELNHNYTTNRELFIEIRNASTLDERAFSTKSLMVDLYDFVNNLLPYCDQFYYGGGISTLASELLTKIEPNTADIVRGEAHDSRFDGLYGFSICFPDSYDMYQGYLYPNFYEELDISLNTKWDDFIKRLFPELNFNINQFEFWEFQLNLIDPSVGLHVFIDQEPLKNPIHIGLNEFADFGMGVELGLEGAEFYDDLLFGNSMIRIPSESLNSFLAKALSPAEITFKVVINATAAASATQMVNLTVKHVNNQSVIWQANKLSTFERGQTLICEVSTNEEITEFEIIESPFDTPRTILGLPLKWFIVTVVCCVLLLVIIFTIIFYTKRKKSRN